MEREGYAWCLGCSQGRFSGKCRGCRKPIVEGGVKLEVGGKMAEWHEGCFRCAVSDDCSFSLWSFCFWGKEACVLSDLC